MSQLLLTLLMTVGLPDVQAMAEDAAAARPAPPYKAVYHATSDFDAMTEAEQMEFDQMVGTVISQTCLADAEIKLAERELAHQKKVSALTGTSNLTRINNAGSTIVFLTPKRSAGADAYKKVIGKPFPYKECAE